ncbi:MAG TPA: ATP-binding protein [Novimethylophilus sp.]|jgi:ATP-dependent DNA helicase RecG|uniref:ATP-binding protein n=1 Tax=Novimethylophilus sp. TaxID=2137426 RepID=UPI002F414464
MMPMIDFTPAQAVPRIAAMLAAHESRTLDFKRVSGKMVGKALETICAFANTEGGILALGVADEKQERGAARLYGVEENPEALDELTRKVRTQFNPPIEFISFTRLPCTMRDSKAGHVVLVRTVKSDKVHSIVDDGTWTRLDAGNRNMAAAEITELSYRRGLRSAESELVPVPLELLETDTWRSFVAARGLRSGSFAEQLQKIGLASKVGHEVQPTRAAVLLFADEPGSLLAAQGSRADIRLMVYDGKQAVPGATPNLRKAPKAIRGPVIEQIDTAVKIVLDELAQGLILSSSGFKTKHLYPERVVKEAIVNAVVHRDYRLNRDIFIRLFDDRIEVESPGVFPGNITPANVDKAGSKARNPLIAQNLREFPVAPNIDAGEGVKMMFAEMAQAKLYPPQYRQNTETAIESVTVTLLNLERPTVWDEVSHWIDTHGAIANADLCQIAGVHTLSASRMLKAWVDQGVLVPLPDRAKRNMAYTKPTQPPDQQSLLSEANDNKL